MFKIICSNCNKENIFNSKSQKPVECEYCQEDFDPKIEIIESNERDSEITGLRIVYQITQEKLELPVGQKTILGREGFGSHIFSKILYNGHIVISRIHCSIEFKDGKFYLQDEGSKHGTFYGTEKTPCSIKPQIIEDNSVFFLGREAFLAIYLYKDTGLSKEQPAQNKEIETERKISHYRCNTSGCNYKTESYQDVCPVCYTYKSLLTIFE